ncbi:MAG: nucleotide sugar dehydrogenase [Anaerolineae bacterium]|uniref:nucleotide sugar dehydrogenase n=1 Tax=Candidatus Amarolinea dominans TaxID=3140696 RepID=UPI001D92B6DC|nr:nucleotide sugar dehydrogenase [Anaerolineae bacterium]MBK7202667.1 nucleotide sugar dehydrogenase [Anaerolineae bacterium]MBK9096259.1 nucleotide sugar dehydrogenase [Anaerolineae bacterium]MBK9231059.1 nucleotide sugar dehydrogenase [Anaerolineae bacterium]
MPDVERLLDDASPRNPQVVMVGTGYVGLPAALMLARAGWRVVGVDINENIVAAINEGVLHLKEAELQALLHDPTVRQNLSARHSPCPADIFIIAVPTPVQPRKKVADLSYVISAIEALLPHLRAGNLIIIESTIPPLTCRHVVTPLLERTGLRVGADIHLAHCPERILPGDVFYEIVHNDRVIGCAEPVGREMARALYASFVKGDLYVTDDVTAELCKLCENTFRDVNIALANEFAAVAEGLGIDPLQVIRLANKHPRVNIMRPGIGVGGHCIPLDPWFIKEVDPANSRLIFTARLVNDEVPHKIAARVRQAVAHLVTPRLVAIGMSYKPDTEDTRESPATEIVHLLRADGYQVAHYDPLVVGHEYSSLADAAAGADCLLLLVEHKVVKQAWKAEQETVRAAMRTPIVLRFYQDDAP